MPEDHPAVACRHFAASEIDTSAGRIDWCPDCGALREWDAGGTDGWKTPALARGMNLTISAKERDYFRDVLESLKRKIDKALQAPEGTKPK